MLRRIALVATTACVALAGCSGSKSPAPVGSATSSTSAAKSSVQAAPIYLQWSNSDASPITAVRRGAADVVLFYGDRQDSLVLNAVRVSTGETMWSLPSDAGSSSFSYPPTATGGVVVNTEARPNQTVAFTYIDVATGRVLYRNPTVANLDGQVFLCKSNPHDFCFYGGVGNEADDHVYRLVRGKAGFTKVPEDNPEISFTDGIGLTRGKVHWLANLRELGIEPSSPITYQHDAVGGVFVFTVRPPGAEVATGSVRSFGLDAKTGQLRWSLPGVTPSCSSPNAPTGPGMLGNSVTEHLGCRWHSGVFTPDGDYDAKVRGASYDVVGIDWETGTIRWAVPGGTATRMQMNLPTTSSGDLVLGSATQRVSVDPVTGKVATLQKSDQVWKVSIDDVGVDGYSISSISVVPEHGSADDAPRTRWPWTGVVDGGTFIATGAYGLRAYR